MIDVMVCCRDLLCRGGRTPRTPPFFLFACGGLFRLRRASVSSATPPPPSIHMHTYIFIYRERAQTGSRPSTRVRTSTRVRGQARPHPVRGKNNFFFVLRSVLLEETQQTNNTQAPGQDTRWAPHSGRERSTRGTGTETGVGGGVGSGVLAWQRAGQVCYLRRGATGPAGVGELADCGRPHASRGVALLDRGGPLRGGGGGRGAGTVAEDRSPCVPRYGVGWGCAVGLRVGWGCAVRLRVG